MPATGWDGRFDKVAGTLQSAAGSSAARRLGADGAPTSWWERWGLWNVFGVLLIVGFVYWTAGLVPGGDRRARAAAHVPGSAGLHLALGQPARRARHRARRARRDVSSGSRVAIAREFRDPRSRAAAIPVDAGALRAVSAAREPASRPTVDAANALANAAAVIMPRRDCAIARTRIRRCPAPGCAMPPPRRSRTPRKPSSKSRDSRARESLLRDARGLDAELRTQLRCKWCSATPPAPCCRQAPASPPGDYNSYSYYWSGPVNAEDTVRFIYVGPVVLFFWRLIGVIALAALFAGSRC